MCGIVGCVGKVNTREYLINGLKDLDYRGYDSAGLAFLINGKTNVYKVVGSVDKLDEEAPKDIVSSMGIGHTRWATHGRPNTKNSHPHQSMNGIFTIVHNGVIENFQELKADLIEKGYTFKSDTDTEVIANLIECLFKQCNNVTLAIREAMHMIDGSFAISMIYQDDPHHLYLIRRSSPLMVGKGKEFYLVASDATPMIKYTHEVLDLEDDQYAIISENECEVYDIEGQRVEAKYSTKDPDLLVRDLNGYPHYMLKEIEECEQVLRRLMNNFYEDGHFNFEQGLIDEINNSDEILFIACGTSYHASLIGVRYFEQLGKSASAFIASEWAYYPYTPGRHPFVIMLSQSGETADLTHCMNIVKEKGLKSLVITNTKGSHLDRVCDFTILLSAGLEVAVASTKAYVAQTAALALLTSALKNDGNIINDLEKCCKIISSIRTKHQKEIKALAKQFVNSKDLFFLGRGFDYDMCLEASLKLKEVSYIHSEALPGGELKHGPIALIEKDTPVIVFITDEITASSMRNNIQEVKSRGADVRVVSTKSLAKPGDSVVVNDFSYALSPIAVSTVAFYFAYYVSLYKGCNIDKPRNLAKSVTVE